MVLKSDCPDEDMNLMRTLGCAVIERAMEDFVELSRRDHIRNAKAVLRSSYGTHPYGDYSKFVDILELCEYVTDGGIRDTIFAFHLRDLNPDAIRDRILRLGREAEHQKHTTPKTTHDHPRSRRAMVRSIPGAVPDREDIGDEEVTAKEDVDALQLFLEPAGGCPCADGTGRVPGDNSAPGVREPALCETY